MIATFDGVEITVCSQQTLVIFIRLMIFSSNILFLIISIIVRVRSFLFLNVLFVFKDTHLQLFTSGKLNNL